MHNSFTSERPVQGQVVATQTTAVGCFPPQSCVQVAAAADNDGVRCLADQ